MRELLRQCLDKFEHLWDIGIDAEYKVELLPEIRALREELTKHEMPTKLFGPNLEQILNAAGFYRREWVGLTDAEMHKIVDLYTPDEAQPEELMDFVRTVRAVQEKLKEKNETQN